ncbi:MAG: polysaccharide biosynthesis/export family protein [bacterium]
MKITAKEKRAFCQSGTLRLLVVVILSFSNTQLSAAAPEDTNEVYRIGIPDLLNVLVWQQEELSGPALVRTDGKISIPLIGDIRAAGKTPEELAEHIEVALVDYVAKPQVDISVLEMRSQVVSVIGGGIERSGVLELRHDMRVLDAIAEMGGFTPFAKKRDIIVLRTKDDIEEELRFDYVDFIKGRTRGSNFLLAPGDTVVVPE